MLRGEYDGPRQWWGEVIRDSFRLAMKRDNDSGGGDGKTVDLNEKKEETIPDTLIESLIDRFAGSKGYRLYDDVLPFFERMKHLKSNAAQPANSAVNNSNSDTTNINSNGAMNSSAMMVFDRVIVGIISNSDDRVPGILKSLGLNVGDVRSDQGMSSMELRGFEERRNYDMKEKSNQVLDSSERDNTRNPEMNDIDLIITSYEAGEEKPSRAIFDIAKNQAYKLSGRESNERGYDFDTGEWVYVHVGDSYDKDYKAAINAGWKGYHVIRKNDPSEEGDGERKDDPVTISSMMELFPKLEKFT